MKYRRNISTILAAILTVAAVSVFTAVSATAAYAQLSAGTKAPDFTLPTLSGETFTLSKCFGDNPSVVVLDIWATWCPPCRAEIPYLIDLQTKYQEKKNVQIVGVSIDQDKNKVADFAKSQAINYTVVLDSGGSKVGSSYKVLGIPTTYIIDKKGVIRYVHGGFPREQSEQKKEIAKVESEIKTLLDEK